MDEFWRGVEKMSKVTSAITETFSHFSQGGGGIGQLTVPLGVCSPNAVVFHSPAVSHGFIIVQDLSCVGEENKAVAL